METKAFSQVKVSAEGTGEATFATLDVVDKDGDVTIAGAFGEQFAKISPAHDWGAPSMGLAKVSERGDQAVAALEFNLAMASAVEWAESLRFSAEKGIAQEWSYGFDVLEEAFEQRDSGRVRVLKRLKVHEVSPVMVGAGVGTRTNSMKSSRTLAAHCADVVAENRDFAARLADLQVKRAEDGRMLSRTNSERLKQVMEELHDISAQVSELTVDLPTDDAATMAALLLEIERGHRVRQGA